MLIVKVEKNNKQYTIKSNLSLVYAKYYQLYQILKLESFCLTLLCKLHKFSCNSIYVKHK